MISPRILLSLTLLVALLAGLIGYLSWHDKQAETEWQVMNADDVGRIEIFTRPATTSAEVSTTNNENNLVLTTTLERESPGWQLSRPVTVSDGSTENLITDANADRIAPLLALLQLPKRTSYSVSEVELAELGFVPPKARVQMDEIEFLFGDKTTDGSARYVRVQDRVHLYKEFVYPLLSAGPDIFAASEIQQ